MKKISEIFIILCFVSLFLASSTHSAEYINETWDTGTPGANWPCKRVGVTCDSGTLFNGWFGRDFMCDDTSGSLSGLSSTQAKSAPNSYYQHRESGDWYTCDLSHNFDPPYPSTIYIRFYLHLTTNWNSFGTDVLVHWVFTNSQLSNTGFRLNLIDGTAWYTCPGKKIVLDPEGDGGRMWQASNADWQAVHCDIDFADYIGAWHCFEYKLQINQSSPYNVTITEWIDGIQTRGPITGSGQNGPTFTKIAISGYDNTAQSFNGDFYIDNIVVSDSYIGPLSETPPSRKLNNVTGVRVTLH